MVNCTFSLLAVVIFNVLKVGPISESKKLSVHGSLVEPIVVLRLK